MKLHTASEVISFVKQLENESASFYDTLSQKYDQDRDLLLSFAKENGENVVQVERSYYSVITDAIEGCFAFDIESDEYTFKTELADKASYSDALDKLIAIEEKSIKFYSDAAKQSKAMMADVTRAFMMIVKKKEKHVVQLGSLLKK